MTARAARDLALAAALLGLPGAGLCQYAPPRVELEPLTHNEYEHVDADDVAVGDCYAMYRGLSNAELEAVASVRVALYAPWYRTAEHVAQERAGRLGANCLIRQSSSGLENASYPFQAAYKAFRITLPGGPSSLAPRVPAPPDALSPASVPSGGRGRAAEASDGVPGGRRSDAHEHLWSSGNFVFSYEIGLDTAKFPREVWEDVAVDFKEYFPRAEYEKLFEAYRTGAKILVDFRRLRIRIVRTAP